MAKVAWPALIKTPQWLFLFIVCRNLFTSPRNFLGICAKFTHRCFSGFTFPLYWKLRMHSFILVFLASCQDSLDNQQSELKVSLGSWSVICLNQKANSFELGLYFVTVYSPCYLAYMLTPFSEFCLSQFEDHAPWWR